MESSGKAFLAAAMYLAAASALGRAGSLADRGRATQATRLWWGLAGTLVVLALFRLPVWPVNLTEAGREVAVTGGWYAQRRPVQVVALLTVGSFGLLVSWGLIGWVVRHRLPVVPLLGGMILAGYAVIQAASWHGTDQLLALGAGSLRVATLVQAVGLALVVVPALRSREGVPANSDIPR